MKLELSQDTIIRCRSALALLQQQYEYNPHIEREYERAYVELVDAYTKAVKEEFYGEAA